MKHNCFHVISGVIFVVITVMHILRLSFNLAVTIGGWTVPIWMSYGAVVLFGALSFCAFKGCKTCTK